MAKTKQQKIKDFEKRLLADDHTLTEKDVFKYFKLVKQKAITDETFKKVVEKDLPKRIKQFAKAFQKLAAHLTIHYAKYGGEFCDNAYLTFCVGTLGYILETVPSAKEKTKMLNFLVLKILKEQGINELDILKKQQPQQPPPPPLPDGYPSYIG